VQLRNLVYKQLFSVPGMKKQAQRVLCGIYCEIHEAPLEPKFVQASLLTNAVS
jgi:hypothetical protein